MFACQNFLQQSCSKFYKEQKLFYGHLMKMITSCSNSACKAELGVVLALSRIWLSGREQFARTILGISYLSIQADLALSVVVNVVELS